MVSLQQKSPIFLKGAAEEQFGSVKLADIKGAQWSPGKCRDIFEPFLPKNNFLKEKFLLLFSPYHCFGLYNSSSESIFLAIRKKIQKEVLGLTEDSTLVITQLPPEGKQSPGSLEKYIVINTLSDEHISCDHLWPRQYTHSWLNKATHRWERVDKGTDRS